MVWCSEGPTGDKISQSYLFCVILPTLPDISNHRVSHAVFVSTHLYLFPATMYSRGVSSDVERFAILGDLVR